MPLRDIRKRVHAQQQKQFVSRLERLFQPPDRVDRVIRPLDAVPLDRHHTLLRSLQQRRHQRLFVCRRQRQHGKAVHEQRMRLPLFVRRNIRRHKVNAMQFVLLQRRPRQRHMSAVHRIEGPTKKSYIHGVRSAPPSVQIPGRICKPNHAPIVRLALAATANGTLHHSPSSYKK